MTYSLNIIVWFYIQYLLNKLLMNLGTPPILWLVIKKLSIYVYSKKDLYSFSQIHISGTQVFMKKFLIFLEKETST